MGLFDKFKTKKPVPPVQEISVSEGELGESELRKIEAGYPDRKVWLETQIEKMQKENDSGTMSPEHVYQNKIIMAKYQKEVDEINSMKM